MNKLDNFIPEKSKKNHLAVVKEQIKEDKFVLFTKPQLLVYLPLLGLQFFRSRFYSPVEFIYLTETTISKATKLLEKTLPKGYQVKDIYTFLDFVTLAKQRIKEDKISTSYLVKVKERFAQGDYALVLSDKDTPVAFLFISEQYADFQQFKTIIQLPTSHFSCYDVYTFFNSRGKGRYAMLLAETLRQMSDKQYHTMWLWVMAHNQMSVRAHNALGINKVTKILSEYYRFGFRFFKIKKVNLQLHELIE